MNPSGVQLTRPIRPSLRVTRTSSSAAGWWKGANMTPDAGRRDVERAVGVRQGLGVPLVPRDVEPLGPGVRARRGEQLGRQVGCRDLRPHARRRERDGAGAGRDVEQPVAGGDLARLDEHVAQRRDDVGGDRRVVAQRPHGAVLLLDLRGGAVLHGRVGPRRLGGVGHDVLLRGGPRSQRREVGGPASSARSVAAEVQDLYWRGGAGGVHWRAWFRGRGGGPCGR